MSVVSAQFIMSIVRLSPAVLLHLYIQCIVVACVCLHQLVREPTVYIWQMLGLKHVDFANNA